jgi:hypothetical protein
VPTHENLGDASCFLESSELISLAPSEEITHTFSTTADHQEGFENPGFSGDFRVEFAYDPRMSVDYKVVDPVRLLATSLLRMPEKVVKETSTGQEIVGRVPVVFFVVETVPGEFWLFRADSGCCEAEPWFQTRLARGELSQAFASGSFRRLEKLEGPPTALKTELGPNNSINVIVETSGSEARRFNYGEAFEPQR